MKKLEYRIAIGLGDNLVVRIFFDNIKHQYEQIRISHDADIIKTYRNNDPYYIKFLQDIGNLLFTERPYYFDRASYPQIHTHKVIFDHRIVPSKPNLDHLLCKGTSLGLDEPYIVITTKVRILPKKTFMPHSIQLWRTLRKLSQKYKIVVMGEKEVEVSKEYNGHFSSIYSIYEQIVSNVPTDRLIDLTVPALGISVPEIHKIQQDCLIMKEAKFVITLGIGGNLWMAVASANSIIGFREDGDQVTDLVTNPNNPGAFLTKNWDLFISKLERQI